MGCLDSFHCCKLSLCSTYTLDSFRLQLITLRSKYLQGFNFYVEYRIENLTANLNVLEIMFYVRIDVVDKFLSWLDYMWLNSCEPLL